MLDLLILLIFMVGIVAGARRGLVVQAIHMFGFLLAVIVALIYYKPLAQKFLLWIPYPGFAESATSTLALTGIDADRTFYRVIAFALIFFVVKILLQILGSMLDFLKYLPVLGSINRLLGAVLGFVEVYFLLFIILYVVALLPLESIQARLDGSIITGLMLEHSPFISSMFQKWWYIYSK
ncbi:CvpA family protein [Lysinibacillus odysseyi]|uniref:Membrane protein n=1 Tax=Lysinibacillus odysseyi 34hs-1 = NBRC 100172 TaxID=1220589 RepID=A0A0A3IKI1_9BACI|nr:CvpA family protein [Lysinibacillus odysseyi]KGR83303.1 membrane protein [Lysinibacillus odysseyi 34hs-1 = NBRC 100172]